MMKLFQTLLSNSTCAATQRRRLDERGVRHQQGGAVQVDSIKTRVESAAGFCA